LRLEENIEMDIGELRLYGCEINWTEDGKFL
jgi:hypothetical protein